MSRRSDMALRHRLQGRFWQHSDTIRRPLRALRRAASILRHRYLAAIGRAPTRVVSHRRRRSGEPPLAHPLVAVSGEPETVRDFLARQTETSAVAADEATAATFYLAVAGAVDELSPTHLEAAVLAAVAEDLPLVLTGWGAPETGVDTVAIHRHDRGDDVAGFLIHPGAESASPVLGRRVPQIGALRDATQIPTPLLVAAGPYLLRGDIGRGSLHRRHVADLHHRLAELPAAPGPPTVLFLLPYLAVGGAERLLRDLIAEWDDVRVLVVTLEPHRADLGQTVDVLRRATPHVYTLGDWLPREAHLGALEHLLRRYQVATLFSWNGTVLFYDRAAEIGRRFPGLRLVHQLFHHRGGWTERLTPALRARLDVHVAVNRPIAAALAARGAPRERIALVHHGVALPPATAPAVALGERQRLRRRLGLPPDAVVAGTFIRLHRQKRPLDVVRLARRLPEMHFLLVGGGPLDAAVDRELARQPCRNFTRLALHPDATELYPAIDLCLMTSRYEGLPVFLLDGMARGLPAVAPAVGDVPLLFAEGGGIAVARPGDLDGLAAALRGLLDPRAREVAGAAARRTVATSFGLERYRRAYRDLIFPLS